LLAKRLLAGDAIQEGAVPGTLGADAARASMPLALVQSTIEAAALVARGQAIAQGAFSNSALTLAKGVMRTMFWNRIKLVGFAILTTAVLAGLGGRAMQLVAVSANEQQAEQPVTRDRPVNDEKPVDDVQAGQPDDNKILVLSKQLVDAGQVQCDTRMDEYNAGKTSVDFVLNASRELLKAEVRLAAKKNDGSIIAAHQAHVQRMQQLERISQAKYEAGQVAITGYAQVTYARIEAEIWLEEARRSAPPIDNKAKKGNLAGMAQSTKPATEGDKQLVVQAARQRFEACWAEYLAGKTIVEFVLNAANDLLKTELDAADNKGAKIAVYEAHFQKTEELLMVATAKYEGGQISLPRYSQIRGQLDNFRTQLMQARNAK
jgi:hypothetical protein